MRDLDACHERCFEGRTEIVNGRERLIQTDKEIIREETVILLCQESR